MPSTFKTFFAVREEQFLLYFFLTFRADVDIRAALHEYRDVILAQLEQSKHAVATRHVFGQRHFVHVRHRIVPLPAITGTRGANKLNRL